MRFLMSLLLVAGIGTVAQSHFVYVYVEGGEAKVVFGHSAAPDLKAPAARCEKTALVVRDADGKETRLPAVEKGDGNFYRVKLPGQKPVVVMGTTDAGVTQYADNPPMLSWYYPKVIVGDPFVKGIAAPESTALDVVPVRDGNKVRFKVTALGKPAADVEVAVGLSGSAEEKTRTVKTGKDGLTESFAEKGRYCVAAKQTMNNPGERGGKKYTAIRHIATLVFDFSPAQ